MAGVHAVPRSPGSITGASDVPYSPFFGLRRGLVYKRYDRLGDGVVVALCSVTLLLKGSVSILIFTGVTPNGGQKSGKKNKGFALAISLPPTALVDRVHEPGHVSLSSCVAGREELIPTSVPKMPPIRLGVAR